jgi:hypothetical protein
MIEVAHLGRIEGYAFAVIHPYRELTSAPNLFHRSEIAVGNAKLSRRRIKLKSIPNRKLPLDLAVGADAVEPRGIVGDVSHPPSGAEHRFSGNSAVNSG